jgi:hypothetical protein
MKNTIFWDITRCSLVVHQHFGGKYRLHFRGRRVNQARNTLLAVRRLLDLFTLKMEKSGILQSV